MSMQGEDIDSRLPIQVLALILIQTGGGCEPWGAYGAGPDTPISDSWNQRATKHTVGTWLQYCPGAVPLGISLLRVAPVWGQRGKWVLKAGGRERTAGAAATGGTKSCSGERAPENI